MLDILKNICPVCGEQLDATGKCTNETCRYEKGGK